MFVRRLPDIAEGHRVSGTKIGSLGFARCCHNNSTSSIALKPLLFGPKTNHVAMLSGGLGGGGVTAGPTKTPVANFRATCH